MRCTRCGNRFRRKQMTRQSYNRLKRNTLMMRTPDGGGVFHRWCDNCEARY